MGKKLNVEMAEKTDVFMLPIHPSVSSSINLLSLQGQDSTHTRGELETASHLIVTVSDCERKAERQRDPPALVRGREIKEARVPAPEAFGKSRCTRALTATR